MARYEIDNLMDGSESDDSTQPLLIVAFISVTAFITYSAFLLNFATELWEQRPWATRWLQYRNFFNPGTLIFVPMMPLLLHQTWTVWRVLDSAGKVRCQILSNSFVYFNIQ